MIVLKILFKSFSFLQEQETLKLNAPSAAEGEEVVTEEVKEAAKEEAEAVDAEWHQKSDQGEGPPQHHAAPTAESSAHPADANSSTKGLGLGFDEVSGRRKI